MLVGTVMVPLLPPSLRGHRQGGAGLILFFLSGSQSYDDIGLLRDSTVSHGQSMSLPGDVGSLSISGPL